MSVHVSAWWFPRKLAMVGLVLALSSLSGVAMAQHHGGGHGGHAGGGGHMHSGGGHMHSGGGYSGGSHYHGGSHHYGGYGGTPYYGSYYGGGLGGYGLGGFGLSLGYPYYGGYGVGNYYGLSGYGLGGYGLGSSYYGSYPLSPYSSPLNGSRYGVGSNVYVRPRVYAPSTGTYSVAKPVNPAPASNVYQGGFNDKGEPTGALVPGMVLPDGAIVTSVGK